MLVVGLDVGTGGARAVAVDERGSVRAEASVPFIGAEVEGVPPGRAEQRAEIWWDAACRALKQVAGTIGKEPVRAIACDSTSGTFVPVGPDGHPLRPALMYNDNRAVAEADAVNRAAAGLNDRLGCRFPPVFTLPKLLWLKVNEPQFFERTHCFLHATDYLTYRLTGQFVTETSSALKSGVDLIDGHWPAFIESLGIPASKLPRVLSPGDIVGPVSRAAAEETGLSPDTLVAAGLSDGTASFLASGAVREGDWNSALGTTLVVRGVSRRLVKDPEGRIYCHRHPEGFWLPGGASNIGGEAISRRFPGKDWQSLDLQAARLTPTRLVAYPLARTGERLPFVSASAEGFVEGQPESREALYAACLEGVAYAERWIYEVLSGLEAAAGDTVYATGGGAKSRVWLQIRADILQKRLVRPKTPEAALGAAIVAASKTLFSGPSEAAAQMVSAAETVEPDRTGRYEEGYLRFRQACRERYGV
ncbi:MAG: FGGY-family carbohydrate kinase [Armatimonadetes bacterium]|nr:FGGY-family carbohydrate kinase [Armatimonadota bacterium]